MERSKTPLANPPGLSRKKTGSLSNRTQNGLGLGSPRNLVAVLRSACAGAFIAAMLTLGCAEFLVAGAGWRTSRPDKFLCYLIIAIAASLLKVKLPGVTSTMSLNFLFVLVGMIELTIPETLIVGCVATLIQSLWRTKSRPRPVQVLFNVMTITVAIAVTASVASAPFLRGFGPNDPIRLAAVACTYFVANTFPVGAIIALTERKSFRKIWNDCYFWSFPYYMIGAAIAQLLHLANQRFGWQISALVLPLVYLVFRSYSAYLGRLASEKVHAEEVAALHLRTIEALSLAIDAKDRTTSDHLRRVELSAVEIGREIGLSQDELDALRAAALLHDIGKLAVPEHIISKPGTLTPEEFEKMKIHAIVGAEILEEVDFPYPVVPIVRAHHEKWDGSGYPCGLRGEEIPIGARILAVVDCLDALASDRQYRRAMPLREAMSQVASEAGTSYDPKVVEILARRYLEFEEKVRKLPLSKRKRPGQAGIANGMAPDSVLDASQDPRNAPPPAQQALIFLDTIAAARQEVQALFELTQDLGNSLSLSETLSVLAVRLKRIVPHDAAAIYVVEDGCVVPEYVSGDDFRLFSSLRIPLGEGLSGWVAANNKPLINGNPSVEPSYLNDPAKFSILRSALAVPLNGLRGVVGVLTLYGSQKDAFTRDNLRVLLALSSKVSMAVENALKYRQAESCATTDFLTGLPNARSLFLHLDAEVSRAERAEAPLVVLVCDLDGFKQINDRFGHLQGNRLLQLVANSFKQHCREYDYVARMGGDEFVLVMPGLSRSNLVERISQLETAVLAASKEVCGESLVSLSVGTAMYPDQGIDAESLLSNADRAMYVTKRSRKARPDATDEQPVNWLTTTAQ
jgi:diguanylate cyclase (GGDEF)-like protein/putative nucleotidyltransferase with HDIG domain